MTHDESPLQELAARLAEEEQVIVVLREKLAKMQADPVGQQMPAPVALSLNQPAETTTVSPLPASAVPARSGHRCFPTRQKVSLLVMLVILLIGGTVGIQALRTRWSSTEPAGKITEFALPILKSIPLKITAGPDGNLWFAESGADKIGRITPNGTITEFALSTSSSSPAGITAGPDGNLWFTETSGKIGRITSGK